jgi:hypothetical protein
MTEPQGLTAFELTHDGCNVGSGCIYPANHVGTEVDVDGSRAAMDLHAGTNTPFWPD